MKNLFLYLLGGLSYVAIEYLWRGRSHWSMFLLGGLSFIIIYYFNLKIKANIFIKALLSAVTITVLEFITCCIVNSAFDMHVWDYSNMPLNLFGQICLPFFVLWFFLSIPVIIISSLIENEYKKEKAQLNN